MELLEVFIDSNESNTTSTYQDGPLFLPSTLIKIDKMLKQCLGVIAFLINFLLFVMFSVKKKRMASEVLICCNALLEMCICAVVLIKTAFSKILLEILSQSMLCSFEFFPYTFLTTMSFLLVITISVNRYVAVKKSWKYQSWFSVRIVTRWLIIMTLLVLAHSLPELVICFGLSDWLNEMYPNYWLISRVILVLLCWMSLYAVYKGISNYFAHSFLAPLYNPMILHSDDNKSDPSPNAVISPDSKRQNPTEKQDCSRKYTTNAMLAPLEPNARKCTGISMDGQKRSSFSENLLKSDLKQTKSHSPNEENPKLSDAGLHRQMLSSKVEVHFCKEELYSIDTNKLELGISKRTYSVSGLPSLHLSGAIDEKFSCACDSYAKQCNCTGTFRTQITTCIQELVAEDVKETAVDSAIEYSRDIEHRISECSVGSCEMNAQKDYLDVNVGAAHPRLSLDSTRSTLTSFYPSENSGDDISMASNRNSADSKNEKEGFQRTRTEAKGSRPVGRFSRVAGSRGKTMKKALKRRRLRNQKHKVTFSLFMVCLLYLVIVLPQLLLQVLNYFSSVVSPTVVLKIYAITETIYMLNFIINPLLYFYCSSYLCKKINSLRSFLHVKAKINSDQQLKDNCKNYVEC